MKTPAKAILAVIFALFLFGIGYGLKTWWYLGNNIGYAPIQPIPFSHKIHAGVSNIPCAYCHVGVETSRHALIPSVGTCMNCHRVVKTDSPLIQKLKESYDLGKPIEWLKVHDLPDHVRFTHARHIAKNIDCADCHGDVKKMARIEQVKTLQMGFCLDCHRSPKVNASINCQTCHY